MSEENKNEQVDVRLGMLQNHNPILAGAVNALIQFVRANQAQVQDQAPVQGQEGQVPVPNQVPGQVPN